MERPESRLSSVVIFVAAAAAAARIVVVVTVIVVVIEGLVVEVAIMRSHFLFMAYILAVFSESNEPNVCIRYFEF
jgi:hypothetical protein